ncbi:MAG: glycerophosphodiester phosphodiesterase family protein [Bacteroidia bacterium]|nr:glycerophosphodiester phosphodiesterase family protein [Bacteroidia bacterium]
MKKLTLQTCMIAVFIAILVSCHTNGKINSIKLIAHRGGVIENDSPENSKEALLKAVERGYWAVELDTRMTKDSVLITHHDKDFNRYFNLNHQVSEMTWLEIDSLISESGTKVQKLEDALSLCVEKGLNVMIDNKISGFPLPVFEELISLLDKYNLRTNALMIGTTESTEYFTGKIRLSCTRQQIEQNMLRTDYSPNNYYYFGNPSTEDAKWAAENDIMVVGVINTWALPKESEQEEVEKIIENLKDNKVEYIQLDSKYDSCFLTSEK